MNKLNNEERTKLKLNTEDLKKQLREIRDAVTWLLDSIEITNEGNNISNSIRNNNKYFI